MVPPVLAPEERVVAHGRYAGPIPWKLACGVYALLVALHVLHFVRALRRVDDFVRMEERMGIECTRARSAGLFAVEYTWHYQGWPAPSTITIFTPALTVAGVVAVEALRRSRWRRRRFVETDQRFVALDAADRWLGQTAAGDPTRRDLLRTFVRPLRQVEVDDVLAPGEQVRWSGRTHGHPVTRSALLAHVGIVAAYLALCGVSIGWARSGATSTTFTTSSRGFALNATLPPPVPGGSATRSISLPWPYWLLPIMAVVELVRAVRWRSRRYAITDRRAFAIGFRGKWLGQIARSDVAEVSLQRTNVLLRSASGSLRFEGVEDAEAARSAWS